MYFHEWCTLAGSRLLLNDQNPAGSMASGNADFSGPMIHMAQRGNSDHLEFHGWAGASTA